LRCLDNNDKTKNGKSNWKSPLRWMNKIIEEFKLKGEETDEKSGHRGIYESNSKKEEGKGIKLNKEEKEKLFAKLKQYRTEYVPEDEIILRNKFIFKGKTMDSYCQIFCKKMPEVKIIPIHSSKDIKNAFYSGVLPLKMPKFWEIEEQSLIAEKGGEEKEEDLSSYAKYKKEKGLWNKK
jgi:superfamily II DNA helicase RecQ